MTTVGVAGIGRMGGAMSRALARAGHDLVLYNRTPSRAEALAGELGARAVATPAAVAAESEVAITMLADEAAVEAVYGGPDGLVARARHGSVLVDMSTVPPSTILSLEPRVRSTGAGLLDAPVSGSVALADTGQLTIMVGGSDADLERARPVLEALAQRIFHLGPLGSGAAMKLAVNAVIFGLNNALGEALALAERAGIERSSAYDVLAASAVGAPYVGYKRAAFLDPDGTPTAFALELAEKDLRLITAFAASLRVAVPQAEANLALIREAATALGPERDFSSVATYLRESSASGATTRAS
jgi:3-hydroxyisobutyrate dehydrogenase-like beta-hydroxyacid dehydrogenase